MSVTFSPNTLTFADCVERIKKSLGTTQLRRDKIVTSRDAEAVKAFRSLKCDGVPGGFTKYQLPVYFDGGPGAQFFVSVGAPDAEVPEHSHDEGDGFRFIVNGSIVYDGQELGAGDWMFLPKGTRYSFNVGNYGVTMFYCYQCCCK